MQSSANPWSGGEVVLALIFKDAERDQVEIMTEHLVEGAYIKIKVALTANPVW